MGVKGYIHSIESFGALDGPGIRYVLFMQGCPLRCLYCHNPDTWRMEDGKAVTTDDIMADILRYSNFISSGGVTLSGGEPLFQPDFCLDLIKKCKEYGIHTAIDTAGSVDLSISSACIDECDMLLLDIKDLDYIGAIKLTGNENSNTLATLDYCEKLGKPVWIRHVLLPGYTLSSKKLKVLAEFLSMYSCIDRVELLPFHKMGEYKWEQAEQEYKLYNTPVPTEDEIRSAKEIFKDYKLPV